MEILKIVITLRWSVSPSTRSLHVILLYKKVHPFAYMYVIPHVRLRKIIGHSVGFERCIQNSNDFYRWA